MTAPTIGFVGLGHMGGNMASRYLAADYAVYGNARTKERARPLLDEGLQWCASPRALARAVEIIFTSIPDDAALEEVASGDDGILAGLEAGKTWLDVSTVSPRVSREIAARAREREAVMLDAPVSGSVPQVQAGTLTIMVGGDEHAYERVEPVLRELGTATRIGENGQGLVLKLAINISLALQTLAFSEGLLLAERDGIDPQLAADEMSSSPIGSPMLKARVPLFLDLPQEAWFDIELMHKDIRLARGTAEEQAIRLPSAAVADEVLAEATARGYGHRDIAALHDVLGGATPGGHSD
jgi:3-hydroxyisobutyrate dehydrogenase-like beta-hydroxyacid dehydrogenase